MGALNKDIRPEGKEGIYVFATNVSMSPCLSKLGGRGQSTGTLSNCWRR